MSTAAGKPRPEDKRRIVSNVNGLLLFNINERARWLLSGYAALTRPTRINLSKPGSCFVAVPKDGLSSGPVFSPFASLPPLAQVVGWLIVSHHRLPTPSVLPIPGMKGLPKGLPLDSQHWRTHSAKVAQLLLQSLKTEPRDLRDEAYVLHLARRGPVDATLQLYPL